MMLRHHSSIHNSQNITSPTGLVRISHLNTMINDSKSHLLLSWALSHVPGNCYFLYIIGQTLVKQDELLLDLTVWVLP